MIKIMRKLVGFILIILDKLTSPTPLKIDDTQRSQINKKSQGLELYEFKACPFCIKVKRYMKKNNIELIHKDAKNDQAVRDEFLKGGGRIKVPCLKITEKENVKWLYESNDIIEYLGERVLNQEPFVQS